jgi:hypothetical protein
LLSYKERDLKMFKNICSAFNSITQWFLIRVDRVKNPNCRNYNTACRISDHYIQAFTLPIGEKDISEELSEIGEVGTAILNRLFEIPGIKEIFLKEYLVTIVKDPNYSWKEIQPQILDAIIPN